MTLRVLIVDDEPVARRGIARRLAAESDIEIVGECGDGAATIAAIQALTPNLVFLDIQMPELSGFDVVNAIGIDSMPAVIFVTAYDEFAVRAFDVHALDYLLKPVEDERFSRALMHARAVHRRDEAASRFATVWQELGRTQPTRWAQRLAIKTGGRVLLIDVCDIDRIVAAGNYAQVSTGGRTHLLRETMASLEARLDPNRFARVSRSAMVNMAGVREIQPLFNGDFLVVLATGARVPGSRRFRASLERLRTN